jgi:hypothetical protein
MIPVPIAQPVIGKKTIPIAIVLAAFTNNIYLLHKKKKKVFYKKILNMKLGYSIKIDMRFKYHDLYSHVKKYSIGNLQ